MKKIFAMALLGLFLGFAPMASAQEEVKETAKEGAQKVGKGAKKVGKAVKKGAKKAAHNTAEAGSKGKAKVTDQKYEGKVAPNGETVYIDGANNYYWIDEKGKKHYVRKEELKDKPEGSPTP